MTPQGNRSGSSSGRTPRAADLIRPAIIGLPPDTPAGDCLDRMRRSGSDYFAILEGDRVVGTVTDWDLAKAVQHRLRSQPVAMFMTTPPVAVRPGTSWIRMYRLMAENRVEHLAVIRDGRLLGMVSQSDLLQAWPSQDMKFQEERPSSRGAEDLADVMRKRYTARLFRDLRRAGRLGLQRGEEIFLVGGSVRDLLLGVPDVDIDIAVVGDGMAFARKYVDLHGGRVVCYRRFATALMVLPGKLKIDVVSARWEKYKNPGALPAVEPGALVHDLYRRDFTINSMAIRLSGAHFGRLVDPFGGRRDLARKTIDVMHNLSFVEDPTRMIRAVRFEGRYGFHISGRTQHLLRMAAEAHMLDRISGQRLREELLILLREKSPLPALRRLDQLGVLHSLSRQLKLSSELVRLLERIGRRLRGWRSLWPDDDLESWLVYLLGLFSRLSFSETVRLAGRLNLHRRAKESLQLTHRFEREVLKALEARRRPANSLLYGLLHRYSPEVLVYFTAASTRRSVAGRIIHYRRHLHEVELDIRGEDLKKMGLAPGAIYQRILNQVLTAKLDGQLSGRRDQLDMARRLARSAE